MIQLQFGNLDSLILSAYPEKVSLANVKVLTPNVHLLAGGHLDLPVALGLVGVVLGEVGRFDGNLSTEYDNICWFS